MKKLEVLTGKAIKEIRELLRLLRQGIHEDEYPTPGELTGLYIKPKNSLGYYSQPVNHPLFY